MAERKVIADLRQIAEGLMTQTMALMRADTDDKALNDQLKNAATSLLNISADIGHVIIDVRHLPTKAE